MKGKLAISSSMLIVFLFDEGLFPDGPKDAGKNTATKTVCKTCCRDSDAFGVSVRSTCRQFTNQFLASAAVLIIPTHGFVPAWRSDASKVIASYRELVGIE